MELKTLSLSDTIRTRLETALESIKNRYNYSQDAQLLLDAFSAALWSEDAETCRKFGLSPQSPQERKEAAALASTLIHMADATGNPAFIINNLPADDTLNKLALAGLSLSINTGQMLDEKQHDTSTAKHIYALEHRDTTSLLSHASIGLHSDTAGNIECPSIRILGGSIMGSSPLPTKVALVEEMIDEAAAILDAGRTDTFKDAIPPNWDKQAIRQALIHTLEAPIWGERELAHYQAPNNLTHSTHAAIYKTPHTQSGAPAYGLLRNPYALIPSYALESLQPYGVTNAFVKAANAALKTSLDALKETAAGEALQPGQALVWNDHFVVHGAGLLQQDTALTTRQLHSLTTRGGMPLPDKAHFPGSQPLFSERLSAEDKPIQPINWRE